MHRSIAQSARDLRQLPAYLRGQRRRLINFSWAGGASVVVAVSSLGMLALNTRGLGASDFGVFVALQAFVALCGTICATESWQSLCRLGCDLDVDMRRLCRQALLLDAVAAFAAFLLASVVLFFAVQWTGLGVQYRDLALIHAVSLLAGLSGAPRGYFRLRDRFDVIAANQVFNAVLGLMLAAVLLWRGAGLVSYVYAFTLLAIVYKLQLLAAMLWHLRRETGGARRFRFGQIARMSLGVSVLTTLINARRNIAILVVSAVLGPVATGLFGAAIKCTTPIARLGEMMKQVLFADVIRTFRAAKVPEDRIGKLRVISLIMLAAVVGASAVLGLVAEPLLGVLLGDAYRAAAAVLVLLMLAEGVQLAGTVFNPVLQARGMIRWLAAIYAATLGGFVAIALGWGQGLGLAGLAAVLMGTFVLAYAAQYALVFGNHKSGLGQVRRGGAA